MDQTAVSPTPRVRAISSEPASTRPNPFEDDELSARKRRRTSMSGGASPARSAGTAAARSSEGTGGDSGPHPPSQESSMAIDDAPPPSSPHTPAHTPDRQRTPPEPVSSRVTINLRSTQPPLEPIPSSPLSSKLPAEPAETGAEELSHADDVKVSVEESEIDMTQGDRTSESTPISSALDLGSPPVEVVDVQPDEDSDFGAGQPQVTILTDLRDTPVEDPTGGFPYRNEGEHLHESLSRVNQYILTHEGVSLNLREWIDNYLEYAKVADDALLYESYQEHKVLWHGLPDIVMRSFYQRESVRDRNIRAQLTDLYLAFAKLTAHFLYMDLFTIGSVIASADTNPPDLACPAYLNSLYNLCRREEATPISDQYHNWDDVGDVLDNFLLYKQVSPVSPIGCYAGLAKFAEAHLALLPQFPRLNDNLHYTCQLCSLLVHLDLSRPQLANSDAALAVERRRERIGRGFNLYKKVSTALTSLMEKNITSLSHEHTGMTIKALAEMVQLALQVEHPWCAQYAADFKNTYPEIAHHFVPDVIASEYRISMYSKLIMSSQMQLRVMAVAQLCTDLIAVWKRFSEPQDPQAVIVQQHFAEFLLGTGLVTYILGPTCHPEITNESGNIIGFLVVTHTYLNEHSDLLWQTATTTQDPRVSDALLRMILRIGNLFDYGGLIYLCGKLQSLPIENFSATVREFTDIILRNAVQKSPANRLEPAAYSLCLRLIRESSVLGTRSPVAHPEVRDFANAKFKDLLINLPDTESRSSLFEDCMRDIDEKSPTTLGSLTAMHHLINPFWARDLAMLSARSPLAKLVVDELEHAIAAGHKAGYLPVISGPTNYPRKELIHQLLYIMPQNITVDGLGRRLWDMMVGGRAACQEDRDASWKILNALSGRGRPDNPFLRMCLAEYLSELPADCFSSGTLEFLWLAISPLVNDPLSDVLDEDERGEHGAIEQVWRMILSTANSDLQRQAINMLVNEIYLNSQSILAFSHHRARKVHLGFVDRCLKQLFSAAELLKAYASASPASSISAVDGESMVIVGSETQVQEQSLLFVRTLSILQEFHRLYALSTHFATPDMRSLPLAPPSEVEGASAELKFQSFDGNTQTEVQDLTIGKRNTAASLLASLKVATGFSNYRIYYRGKAFMPLESDICKSLEDLRIHNGLILVKRESDDVPSSSPARQGATPVETEIQSHFERLWECLSMSEAMAAEIYNFLIRLPVDEHILDAIRKDSASPTDIFPVGQTYKSLYAIHAMKDLFDSLRVAKNPSGQDEEGSAGPEEHDLARILGLAVAALRRQDLIELATEYSRPLVMSSILDIILGVIYGQTDPPGRRMFSGPLRAETPVQTSLPSVVVNCLDGNLVRRFIALLALGMAAPSSNESAILLTILFRALIGCAVTTTECWEVFTGAPEIPELLEGLLIRHPADFVRLRVREYTVAVFRQRASFFIPVNEVESFFWPLALRMVAPAMQHPLQCNDAFVLWIDLFATMKESNSTTVDSQALLDMVSQFLMSYEANEDMTQPDRVDVAIYKLAEMLKLILAGPLADQGLKPPHNLTHCIFWEHLFPPWIERGNRPSRRYVINPHTRANLMQILLAVAGKHQQHVEELVVDLQSLVLCDAEQTDEDQYHTEIPFGFERGKAIRAACGYSGLRNLSNTCYLNSLFTQLFMNVGFRKFMLEAEVQDQEYQRLLFETQSVFGLLQDTLRRSVDPTDCVGCIRTYDDTSIDIHNQMDVDEFYNLLFDRWEGQLLTAESKKTFRAFYGGQLVQQVRSKECEHISEILEPFSAIQCDIKGKSSLQESLQAYVDGEIMGGDNKYKCSTCDRHVDAVKRACLKDIPDNLIFHLKRFDFNLRSLTRNKINDYFAFPARIDMRPYTSEYLSDPSEERPPDEFELVGVLVHMGTAESGHYYSFIRERPSGVGHGESWVEFNDDLVVPWDPANLESSCFGGTEPGRYDTSGQPSEKAYSAYMLFYQRASALAKEQDALAVAASPPPVRVALPAELGTFVDRENTSLVRRHLLFDPSHIAFVNSVLVRFRELTAARCNDPHHEPDRRAVETALGHLDQVAARAKDTPDLGSLLQILTQWAEACPRCAEAMFEYLHERRLPFRMLLQRNADVNVRAEASDFFITLLKIVKMARPAAYGDEPRPGSGRPSLMHQAMNLISDLWEYFHMSLRAWPETFGFMLAFVRLGRKEMALFLDQEHLQRLVLVIAAEPNDPNHPQFARMAQTVTRRLATRPPSYENIIELLSEVLANMTLPVSTAAAHQNDHEPYARWNTACSDPDALFELTRGDMMLITRDWPRGPANIFVDKLVGVNQNPLATDSVISTLIDLCPLTEAKVFNTLVAAISGGAVQHNLPAFLHAAEVFVRRSRTGRARELYIHVCEQCRVLQNIEGRAFLDFHLDLFDKLDIDHGQEPVAWPRDGLNYLHRWVPGLLAYYDVPISTDVYDFLCQQVLVFGPRHIFDDASGGMARSQAVDRAVRRMGVECLRYLRDSYVKRNTQIGKQIAQTFHRFLEQCSQYIDHNPDTMNSWDIEFVKLRQTVFEPLQTLIVDDVENDDSDWEQSMGSSEPIESLGDFGLQGGGDMTDGDVQ